MPQYIATSKENVLDLLGSAAVAQRSFDMDAKLVRAAASRHHRDHHKRLAREGERRPAPNIAIGVGIDDVLQRRAEGAHGIHARVDRLGAEHLATQLHPFSERSRVSMLASSV
jgi:hypothetical protein